MLIEENISQQTFSSAKLRISGKGKEAGREGRIAKQSIVSILLDHGITQVHNLTILDENKRSSRTEPANHTCTTGNRIMTR
jgi:hypothetical protein